MPSNRTKMLFPYQHFSTMGIIHPDFFCHPRKKKKKLGRQFYRKLFFFFYLSVVKLHPPSSLKIADFHLSAKKPELIWRGAIRRTLWIFWRTSRAWTWKANFICGIFRLGPEKCGNPFIMWKDNERCAPTKQSKPDSKRQRIFRVSPIKHTIILLKNNINM